MLTRITRNVVLGAIYISFSLTVLSPLSLAQRFDDRLKEIKIEGAQRIEHETIKSYMGIDVGDSISEPALDKALKNFPEIREKVEKTSRKDREQVLVSAFEDFITKL